MWWWFIQGYLYKQMWMNLSYALEFEMGKGPRLSLFLCQFVCPTVTHSLSLSASIIKLMLKLQATMAKGRIKNNTNSYEEARKQRLEDNKKRFQDLGISKISKSLSEIIKPEKKSPVKNQIRYRSKMNLEMLEPRRSSRARNPVVSYHEEAANINLPHFRRKFRSSSSTSYVARPLDEVKVATYAQRVYARKQAEVLQSNLQSEHPTFVKSMLRSHVYSCFWLGLPSDFCREHLPSNEVKMVLENENGLEYEAVYIGSRVGLSGGWRAFALDHKLDDGDALVFELTEPDRFRVYIVRAYADDDRMMEANGVEVIKAREDRIAKSKKGKKIQKNAEPKEPMEMSETSDESIPRKQKGGLGKKAKNCKKVTFSKKLVKVMNNDSDSSDHSIEEDYEEEETTDMITSPKLQTEEVSNKLFRRSSRLTKNRM